MKNVEILYFAADPLSITPDGTTRRLLLDEEVRQIRRQVDLAPFGKKLHFDTHGAARTDDVLQAMIETRPQIVHFSGHGGVNGLVLVAADGITAQRVPPEGLYDLFKTFPGKIRVVVLNACFSLDQARAIADIVGCAIGAPGKLLDPAAIIFAARFYRAIASGESVQAAANKGRLALQLQNYQQSEWPQLVWRAGVDPARVFLIPPRAARIRRRVGAAIAAVTLSSGAIYAGHELIDRSENTVDVPSSPRAALEAARELRNAGNHEAAFPLFKRAAEDGDSEAMGFLGIAYLNGEGTTREPAVGVMWLRRAIETSRDARAMNALGMAYEEGEGVERRNHLARHWYLAAAEEKGYPDAMRNLGRLYQQVGADSTDREALHWYEKATRAGSPDAMVDIGLMYEEGVAGIRDTAAALHWYSAAARAGSSRGMFAIGRVYENGVGVKQNYAYARVWYLKAARARLADAMYRLGVLYQNGWGVRQSREEAINWFQRAADAGSTVARANLSAVGVR